MSQPEYPPLPLKNLLDQVRTELEEAVAERKKTGRAAMFRLEDITLEINVTVKREETVKGEATGKLIVAEFKTEGQKTTGSEQVHKVIVRLTAHEPEETGGGPIYTMVKANAMAEAIAKSKPILLGNLNAKLGLTPKQSGLLGKLVRGKNVCLIPKKFPDFDPPEQ
jgi:hypothetical protein